MPPTLARLVDAAIPLALGLAILVSRSVGRKRRAQDDAAAAADPVRARRQRLVRLLAMALCLVGAFNVVRALSAPGPGPGEELAEVVRRLKPTLPQRLDETSRLVDATHGDRSLTYVVALTGVERDHADMEALRGQLERRRAALCQDANVGKLHDRGVELVVRYVDDAGAKLTHLLLPPSACGRKDPPELDPTQIELRERVDSMELPAPRPTTPAAPALIP